MRSSGGVMRSRDAFRLRCLTEVKVRPPAPPQPGLDHHPSASDNEQKSCMKGHPASPSGRDAGYHGYQRRMEMIPEIRSSPEH